MVQRGLALGGIYVVDTNVSMWLDGLNEEPDGRARFDMDEQSRFWAGLDGLMAAGNLKVIGPVADELRRLYPAGLVRLRAPSTDRSPRRNRRVDAAHAAVIAAYPRFVSRAGHVGADPWLIAFAQTYGWTVLTEELPAGLATSRKRQPKIPDVCNDLDIPWTDLRTLAEKLKW